jgi:hypothetical protein
LVLKYADQLVLREVVADNAKGRTLVTFDIRDDGTGNNYTSRQIVGTTALQLHVLTLRQSLGFIPLPQWASQFKVVSVAQVQLGSDSIAFPSPVITSVGGYPVYLEPALYFAAAIVLTLLVCLLEASLTTNFIPSVPEERLADKLEKKKSMAHMLPEVSSDQDRGGGDMLESQKAAHQAVTIDDDEDKLHTPAEAAPAPKKSYRYVDEGGENDGAKRPNDTPGGEGQEGDLQRKKSRAKSFYFTG